MLGRRSLGELRRLRATYGELLERVSRLRLARRDAQGTLELAERGLAIDPLNEMFWQVALEAESVLGLRAAVTGRYEQRRARLTSSGSVSLLPARTRLLYRRLLEQN
jgi:two-component SAPR family response regulator